MNKYKIIIYSSFVVASIVVVLVFLSATTYTQLALASLLYLPLAYCGFEIFPRKKLMRSAVITGALPSSRYSERHDAGIIMPKKEGFGIADIDKRAFLNMIGGAGLALFIYSIFNKRGENLFFGKAAPGSGTVELLGTAGNRIDPAQHQPSDGFNITEVDDSVITFYGFTNREGNWFIMKEDTDSGSFRYARGDSDFPGNWINREKLKYDYFSNVFS